MNEPKQAVALLSGGLDSATALAIALHEGYRVHALTFRYGQRHALEVAAARRIAEAMGVQGHTVADIDLRIFGGSALTGEIDVPRNRTGEEDGIPVTYVPARNTIFLSYALARAETLGCGEIFIGVNAVDYSGYPDCRPEYIAAYQALADLATQVGVEGGGPQIRTPIIDLSKGQIIARGLALGVDYGLTSTCYDPDEQGRACGRCDSCQLRLKGFAECGIPDPVAYSHSEIE